MTIGLGILSWEAHETLRRSLQSHHNNGLFSLFDDACIFFQEITPADRAIAAEFGLRAEGSNENLGIMGGMKEIAKILKTDYILHLENDLLFIANEQSARRQIETAIRYIKTNKMQYCRMETHIESKDEIRKYSRYYPTLNQKDTFARQMRRFLRSAKATRLIGAAVYANGQPHKLFPNYISQLDDSFWAVNSPVMNWSNRAPLYPRHWFLEEIIPFAENNLSSRTVNKKPDLEKELNCT